MRIRVQMRFETVEVASARSVNFETTAANVSRGNRIIENGYDQNLIGFEGFQVGANKNNIVSELDGSYGLYPDTGYPGYVSAQLSDASGNYTPEVSFTLYLTGPRPQHLYLLFDQKARDKPTKLSVTYGSTTVTSTGAASSAWAIELYELGLPTNLSNTPIQVKVLRTSLPYKSVKLLGVSCAESVVYTGKDIKQVICSENSTDSQLTIDPGVVEQYAEISVHDRNRVMFKANEADQLVKELRVKVDAIDDVTATTYELGEYNASEYEFDPDILQVRIVCNDPVHLLDSVLVEAVPVTTRSVDEMLRYAFQLANGAVWGYDSNETQEYCKNIKTPDSWFYTGSVLAFLRKICIVGMLRVYWSVNQYVVRRCW